MRRLRRRYGHASWQGTDYIERRANHAHNLLVGTLFSKSDSPERRHAALAEGRAVLAWLEAQKAPGGSRGRAASFQNRTIDGLRRLIAKVEAL